MKANCLPATAAAAAAAAATAAGGDGGGCLPPLGCSITLQIKETAKSRATVSARETTETPEPWFPLPGDLLAHLLSLVCVALFCCFCANQPRYLAPPLLKSPENNPNHSSSSLSLSVVPCSSPSLSLIIVITIPGSVLPFAPLPSFLPRLPLLV